MRLPGRKKADDTAADVAADANWAAADTAATVGAVPRTTAPKGRPTPKRDAARRRGPVVPAPMTAAEARARRKTMAGPKLSREARKAERIERRAASSDSRERMMAGDSRYLLSRDQGPVRRYVRDVVDARRNVLGLFMPSAMGLLFLMLGLPQVQYYASPGLMLLMLVMAVDGILLGRKVTKMVDAKFPDNTEAHWRLAFYAIGRASQMRRMRAPRPQVGHGDQVD